MLENKNVLDSINYSWELTQQRWWITFGTVFGIFCLSYFSQQIFFSIINSIFSVTSVNSILLISLTSLFFIPLTTISTAIYFIGLRESKQN